MKKTIAIASLVLAGCGNNPPLPDWQMNAHNGIDRATAAYMEGNARIEAAEFKRARSALASTGKVELMIRAELIQCAARVASLVFEDCAGYAKLAPDASPADRAYAAYLAGGQPGAGQAASGAAATERFSGRLPGADQAGSAPASAPASAPITAAAGAGDSGAMLSAADIALLPAQHQAVAAAASDAAAASAVQAIADPLSRLVASGVLLRAGKATPQVLTGAVETASAQGWRRPLLAWLGVQALRAEQAGDSAEVQRIKRRIDLVTEK